MKRITHAVFSDPCIECGNTHPTACMFEEHSKVGFIILALSKADCDRACREISTSSNDGERLICMKWTPEEALEYAIIKNKNIGIVVDDGLKLMPRLESSVLLISMIEGGNGNGNSVKV